MIETYDIRDDGAVPYIVTIDHKAKMARISQRTKKIPAWCYVPVPVEIAFLEVFVPQDNTRKGTVCFFCSANLV